MNAISEPIPRLKQALERPNSPDESAVFSVSREVGAILEGAGWTRADLRILPPGTLPPSLREPAPDWRSACDTVLRDHVARQTPWERQFVGDLGEASRLSDRQRELLDEIVGRVTARGGK